MNKDLSDTLDFWAGAIIKTQTETIHALKEHNKDDKSEERELDDDSEAFSLEAKFDKKKAKDYFDALLNIARQRRVMGSDFYHQDNFYEVGEARTALGLPEDIPEIDNDL